MTTSIYVFSGTGTSYWVAKEVGKTLNAQLRSIPNDLKDEKFKNMDQRIGFVFPCYYGEVPQIVKTFVNQLNMPKVKETFVLVTAGGSAGYSINKLSDLLAKKSIPLNYGKSIVIASNYMVGWYYNSLMPDDSKLNAAIDKAKEQINVYAKEISEERRSVEKGQFLNYIIPKLISPTKIVKDTRPWDQDFKAGDMCNGCGICEDSCPVQNISLKNGKPEFNHNCQRCMACVQYCPKQAIYIEGKRMNKSAYTFPLIKRVELADFNKSNATNEMLNEK